MKSIKLSVAAILNLALLFLLQWLPVAIEGTGTSTDLLFSALIVPQVIAAIFASNLLQVLIPIIVEEKGSIKNGTFGGITLIIALFFIAFYSLLAYFSLNFSGAIYSSYSPLEQEKISWLIKLSLIGSFFTIMVATLSAAFYAEEKPFLIESFGCISGIIAILFMITSFNGDNIDIAIWSINLRWFLCFILLFLFCSSKKMNLKGLTFIKKIIKRFKNLVIGGSIYKTDIVLDRYLSAQSISGDLTILHIVQQSFAALSALLNKVILTPNSSSLAEHNTGRRNKDFEDLIRKIIKKTIILNIFCFTALSIGFLMSRLLPPTIIAGTLFSDWINVGLLTSGIILGGTFGGIFTVRYYSKGDTSTPTKIGLFTFLISCFMKVVGFKFFGFNGLLIAISTHYILNTLIFYFLRRSELKAQLG